MFNNPQKLDFEFFRNQLIGADAVISTPFGERLLVYGDYTASGRCLSLVERYLQSLQRIYANTHTEDDISGRSMTKLLEEAEQHIKRSVNAGPAGRIIACGTGATGAIDKFQQIIGVALPPATRQKLEQLLVDCLGHEQRDSFRRFTNEHQPVVFVGPYEHHSNEISWRQNLATVVPVDIDAQGGIDLAHLERLLKDPAYGGLINNLYIFPLFQFIADPLPTDRRTLIKRSLPVGGEVTERQLISHPTVADALMLMHELVGQSILREVLELCGQHVDERDSVSRVAGGGVPARERVELPDQRVVSLKPGDMVVWNGYAEPVFEVLQAVGDGHRKALTVSGLDIGGVRLGYPSRHIAGAEHDHTFGHGRGHEQHKRITSSFRVVTGGRHDI